MEGNSLQNMAYIEGFKNENPEKAFKELGGLYEFYKKIKTFENK